MSQSPCTTRAAGPLDDPPALYFGLCGLRTGPVAEVNEAPEKHKSSHTALPIISPPASSIRVTTVASTSGTNPSNMAEPFIMGIPARQMLSFNAIFLPASLPALAPFTEHLQYQAFKGFSLPGG